MLLSNYDTWLKTLVETRTPSPPKQRPTSSPGRDYSTFASPASNSYPGAHDSAFRGYTASPGRKSSAVDMASDIQSYSEKLDRIFDGRKSYQSTR